MSCGTVSGWPAGQCKAPHLQVNFSPKLNHSINNLTNHVQMAF